MKKEYCLAGVSILFWGSTASVNAMLIGALSPVQVVLFSSLTAVGFLFLLNLFTGRLGQLRLPPWELLRLGALGLLGMFCVNLCLLIGQSCLKAQQAFIINYIWPILVVLFSCPLLGQRMTVKKSAAMLLSFFGVVIVATEGNLGNLAGIHLPGLLACVAGAACYALFSVLNIRVACDKFAAMLVYYSAAALAALMLVLAGGVPLPALTLPQLGGMLWLGALCNGLAYTAWALAMDLGDTAKLSNLAYITPVVSLVYIYFLLHEPIAWSSCAGLLFILLGVGLQLMGKPASPESGQ